jgi:predicted signal transduction protein with EAL and GGDEF domain
MRATMRRDDILARLGGDEFAFVQMVTQYPREADSLAARVIEVLSRPFDVHGHTVSVGVSIGIATAPADATDAADLMKHADTALYVSKQRGRGQATMYRPEMSQGLRERHELAADLRRAFGRGEFVVLYQPIVDLPTRHVAGFEALVRWVHPTRGEVLPGAFIQIAEECGLLVQLGEWILRTACEDAASWDAEIRVAVNIALQQFETPGFFGLVRSALADAGLPADRLELEITERVMLNEGEHVRSVLQDLRAFGVHISLDDFGTGYSSLNHLQSFPIDKIKIDRSFIGSLGIAAEADAIVRAVVNLGATLGLRTLAEGIETQDQADRMLAARCHQGQGYLFGRPVPAGEVADAVARLGKGPTVPVVPTALPAAAATSASRTIAPA